ncbi:MAG: GNAT family N-acetyltransferase [Candidatus Velthaea sp.]
MTRALEIRRGDERDRAFVLDLGRRVASTSMSEVRPAPLALVEHAFDRLIDYVFGCEYHLLIAHDRGRSLGFALLLHDLPDEVTGMEQGFIAYMAVEPEARRAGAGSALLSAAEDIARAQGLPYLSLMVTEDNAAARALYTGAGFVTERRMLTKPL